MKLGPATKLNKRNKTTSKKKNGDDIMFKNCDVIVMLPIYGQFGPRSGISDVKSVRLLLTVTFYPEKW